MHQAVLIAIDRKAADAPTITAGARVQVEGVGCDGSAIDRLHQGDPLLRQPPLTASVEHSHCGSATGRSTIDDQPVAGGRVAAQVGAEYHRAITDVVVNGQGLETGCAEHQRTVVGQGAQCRVTAYVPAAAVIEQQAVDPPPALGPQSPRQFRAGAEAQVHTAVLGKDIAHQRRAAGLDTDLAGIDGNIVQHCLAGLQKDALGLLPIGTRNNARIHQGELMIAATGQQACAILGTDLTAGQRKAIARRPAVDITPDARRQVPVSGQPGVLQSCHRTIAQCQGGRTVAVGDDLGATDGQTRIVRPHEQTMGRLPMGDDLRLCEAQVGSRSLCQGAEGSGAKGFNPDIARLNAGIAVELVVQVQTQRIRTMSGDAAVAQRRLAGPVIQPVGKLGAVGVDAEAIGHQLRLGHEHPYSACLSSRGADADVIQRGAGGVAIEVEPIAIAGAQRCIANIG